VMKEIEANMAVLENQVSKAKGRELAKLLRCPPSAPGQPGAPLVVALPGVVIRSCRGLVNDYHRCPATFDEEGRECRRDALAAIKRWKDERMISSCPVGAPGDTCRKLGEQLTNCPKTHTKVAKECRANLRYSLQQEIEKLELNKECPYPKHVGFRHNCTKLVKGLQKCAHGARGSECREDKRHALQKLHREANRTISGIGAKKKKDCYSGDLGRLCRKYKRMLLRCPEGAEGNECRTELQKKITAELPGNKSTYPYVFVCPYGFEGIKCRQMLEELHECPKKEAGKDCRDDLRDQLLQWRYAIREGERLERANLRRSMHKRSHHASDDALMGDTDDDDLGASLLEADATPLIRLSSGKSRKENENEEAANTEESPSNYMRELVALGKTAMSDLEGLNNAVVMMES